MQHFNQKKMGHNFVVEIPGARVHRSIQEVKERTHQMAAHESLVPQILKATIPTHKLMGALFLPKALRQLVEDLLDLR